ncbi:MAG: hypothetical protein K8H86_08555 [Ignavibacteriaceae bacterium]|nr:hypothetical protein [Ignavibacteriaceae bacterium]
MKKITLYITLAAAALFISACSINDPNHYNVDNTPPAPPEGVVVYNGDNRADIAWLHNRESDVSGYNIYYNYSYDGKYTLIGSTSDNYYIDYDAENGVEIYYAVAAYDYNGNESELSYDVAYAIPRPEGFNASIFDYINYPNTAGYSFTTYSAVYYKDADFFFENYQGEYYLDVWDDTDIQDMGATTDIYDIPYAPETGWSSTKDEKAIVGHTYVIWTFDNHFAKIRVKNITRDRVVFDWAFQLVPGSTMLKPKAKSGTRNTSDNVMIERRANRVKLEISK